RPVHLQCRAVPLESRDVLEQSSRQMTRIDELLIERRRGHVGKDRGRADPLAVVEQYAVHPAVLHVERADGGAGAYGAAGGPQSTDERVGEPSRATLRNGET